MNEGKKRLIQIVKDNAALVVSFFALLISGLTFFVNHVTPFQPEVIVGNSVGFTTTDLELQEGNFFDIPMIAIPMTIVNKGSQAGIIENLRSFVTFRSNETFLEKRYFVIREIKNIRDLSSLDSSRFSETIEDPFFDVFLFGKQTIHSNYAFVPELKDFKEEDRDFISNNTHLVEVAIQMRIDGNWIEIGNLSFDLVPFGLSEVGKTLHTREFMKEINEGMSSRGDTESVLMRWFILDWSKGITFRRSYRDFTDILYQV